MLELVHFLLYVMLVTVYFLLEDGKTDKSQHNCEKKEGYAGKQISMQL